MQTFPSPARRITRVFCLASALPLVAGGLALVGSQAASAQTLSSNFTVACTQQDVNSGLPFLVDVQATVIVPDNIVVGDMIVPEVGLTLTMPVEVSSVIRRNNKDQIEGDVTATAVVVDGATINPWVSNELPLPLTPVPNGDAPFDIVTFGDFPAYTANNVGPVAIYFMGDAVTVDNIVISDSANGSRITLSPFNCVSPNVQIGTVEVNPKDPGTGPGTGTGSSTGSGSGLGSVGGGAGLGPTN